MSAPRQIRNLVLIGFMGTGKSSVGRLLARQLQFKFFDTDHWIERQAGKSISQIFADEGEPAFRSWERKVVQELEKETQLIIATGGGLGADLENLERLREHSFVVCLWASPETIHDRVGSQTHRPLLNEPDPLEKIRRLLATREAVYRQADILVNTENRTVNEVVQQVMREYRGVAP